MTKPQLESQKNTFPRAGSKNILVLSCSPRGGGHTFELLKKAELAIREIPSINTSVETFADKKIFTCQNCFNHCSQEGHCWQDDDFNSIVRQWLEADGIIIGAPVYTFGPPSTVIAFFERLMALQRANPEFYTSPQWPQPVGIVAQGGSEYSGVEICALRLLSLCKSVGCVPISGDMPGFSQGVIGRICDEGSIPEHMVEGVRRLAARVVEFIEICSAGQDPDPVPLRFLIVKAGMPEETLVDLLDSCSAESQILNTPIDWRVFDFNNTNIEPCLGCVSYCAKNLECKFSDGMQTFRDEWLGADLLFWLSGYGPGSSLAPLRATFDRMNQIRFETFFAAGYHHMPRYLKVSAPIGHTGNMAEPNSATQFFQQVSLLYQHVLLPQFEAKQNQINGRLNPASSAACVDHSSQSIALLIKRSTQLALMIKSGLTRLTNSFPQEYYPSQLRFAQICPTSMQSGEVNLVRGADYPPALV